MLSFNRLFLNVIEILTASCSRADVGSLMTPLSPVQHLLTHARLRYELRGRQQDDGVCGSANPADLPHSSGPRADGTPTVTCARLDPLAAHTCLPSAKVHFTSR